MEKLILVFLVIALVGCGEEQQPQKPQKPFTFHPNKLLNAEQVKKIEPASHVLFDKCTALKQYLPDIVNNTVDVFDAEGFSEKRDFGWQEFVEFDVEISETPNLIPVEYKAFGHHCKFRVSGNEVATQKTMCAAICTGNSTTESQMYIGKNSS